MGGELSAHYSFRDNAYADSGFIAFVILLQLLSGHDQPLSEIVKPFYKYFKAPELNFNIEDKEIEKGKVPTAKLSRILDEIGKKYSDGKQDFLDGITVEYKDWWFNMRPSNTEPLLRLTIEADTRELLAEKQKELTAVITKK